MKLTPGQHQNNYFQTKKNISTNQNQRSKGEEGAKSPWFFRWGAFKVLKSTPSYTQPILGEGEWGKSISIMRTSDVTAEN